jgi:hypothetical protein
MRKLFDTDYWLVFPTKESLRTAIRGGGLTLPSTKAMLFPWKLLETLRHLSSWLRCGCAYSEFHLLFAKFSGC